MITLTEFNHSSESFRIVWDCKSFLSQDAVPTVRLDSLIAVYYEDFDDHFWALSWIMEYCW